MAQTHRHTDRQTDEHGDSMTDPAQRAESVKIAGLYLCFRQFGFAHSTGSDDYIQHKMQEGIFLAYT